MIRRPPRSTHCISSAASDVYKRQFETNVGPTYEGFQHGPVIPTANEPVTVTVSADDNDGVASMTLFHNIDGGTFSQVPMTLVGDVYQGIIPGRSSGQVVQFYVRGTDSLGAVSTFPAAGPESRALYQVADSQGTSRPIETFRIVLTSDDNDHLFSCLLYTSPSPRDATLSRMPSSA